MEKRGLQASVCQQFQYNHDDIRNLNKLIDLIKSKYPETASVIQTKGRFSSKDETKWQCACGHKNAEFQVLCGSCFRDRFGFTEDETSPGEALRELQERVRSLQEVFT